MISNAKTVAEYLAALPPERRSALKKLRALIKNIAPRAKESMQHGLPLYELAGPLFALASQKHYMSLYVAEAAIVKKYRKGLGRLSVGKSCIRFTSLEKLPLDTVERILREAAASRG